jgi:hypothetical protein
MSSDDDDSSPFFRSFNISVKMEPYFMASEGFLDVDNSNRRYRLLCSIGLVLFMLVYDSAGH